MLQYTGHGNLDAMSSDSFRFAGLGLMRRGRA
jgi:hypothetical protein